MKEYIVCIGGGILQIKLIEEITRMGYKSIVFDMNPNCPGAQIADIFFPTSTRDYETIIKTLRENGLIEKVATAITVGTDMSYTVAKINEIVAPFLVSPEVAEKTTNKFLMRKTLKENGINAPEFFLCTSLNEVEEAFKNLKSKNKRVVIKPIDNMGARGVREITKKEELKDSFTEALNYSLSKKVLIEELIEGDELSIDALVHKGEIIITGVADRIIEYPPYFVETGHIMPTNLPNEKVELAINEFRKAVKALGIQNGAAKGDVKVSSDKAYIGEIASRLSGGFMSTHTFPYSTGVNLMRNILLIHLGKEPEIGKYEYKYTAAERAIIPYKGIVTSIEGVEEAQKLEGIKDIIIKVKIGDEITEPKNNLDKAGNIIGIGRTREEAIRNVNRAINTVKIKTEIPEAKLNIIFPKEEEILQTARERFNKSCYVCKECNGEACRGKVPGIGGVGTGETFVENVRALKKYKLNLRYIHNVVETDTRINFLGLTLEMPVVVSPITGTQTNLGGLVDELEYIRSVMKGAMYAGTIAMVGDSATPWKYKLGIRGILENFGLGIGIYKPRKNEEEILRRIREAEEAGAIAVGMDIDGAAFITMKMKNQDVEPKSFEKLKNIIVRTKLPFVIKGVMTKEDAILAYKAGAKIIMVSNHGGRVNDSMPATIDVLPEIVKVLKGKDVLIGIDGGFRSGNDVIKAICMGADFVGIGRPVAIYAFGGGVDGVKMYLEKIKSEIKDTMKLLGVRTIKELKGEKHHLRRVK